MKITKARLQEIIKEEIEQTSVDRRQEAEAKIEEGVVDMNGETIVTGPDGDASPLARASARQDDLQTTMMKAAMEIKDNKPQQAYETLLRALAAAGLETERLPGLGDELDEMYAGYSHSRGGARGSSYSGFPPAAARKLAMRLATMSRNRSLSYGDEKALNAYVGKQKYSTSREAKEDIIKYLVGQRFGNRADYIREELEEGSFESFMGAAALQAAVEDLVKKAEFENRRGRLKDEDLNDIKKMAKAGKPAREIRIKKRLKF